MVPGGAEGRRVNRPAQAFEAVPPWRRIVVASLRAAYAWSKRHEHAKAMREVSRMTGVVMAVHGPGRGPVTPRDLATALHLPLGELPALADCPEPEAAAVVLLRGDELTGEAYDLACEYAAPLGAAIDHEQWLPTWTRMRSEQIRQESYAAMTATGRQDDYVRSRRFLIEHPAGNHDDLMDARSVSGAALAPFGYSQIPAEQLHQPAGGPAWWFPCPTCRWPMAVTGDLVRCRYRPHVAAYRVRQGRSAGHRPVLSRIDAGPAAKTPVPQPAAGGRCVDPGVWRFVVVPGIAELRLFRALDRPGISVELWPELDDYDLHVRVGSTEYRADLKEYQSVGRLVDHLKTTLPDAEVVLPTTHEYQLETLRRAVPRSVVITTEKRFRNRVLRQLKEKS